MEFYTVKDLWDGAGTAKIFEDYFAEYAPNLAADIIDEYGDNETYIAKLGDYTTPANAQKLWGIQVKHFCRRYSRMPAVQEYLTGAPIGGKQSKREINRTTNTEATGSETSGSETTFDPIVTLTSRTSNKQNTTGQSTQNTEGTDDTTETVTENDGRDVETVTNSAYLLFEPRYRIIAAFQTLIQG